MSDSTPRQSQDPRVQAALRNYLERVDRGEAVDRDVFLAGFPEIANELRSFIETSEDLEEFGHDEIRQPDASATSSVAQRDAETIVPRRVQGHSAATDSGQLPAQFGRYRVIKPLGSGAMGTVYLAEDTQLERKVALKTPSFDTDDTGELMERFYREAKSAATLRHSNICPVHDVGEIDGRHYISMAYIEGRPLSAYIQPDRLQSEKQILLIVRKLALALQEAHDHGIVHRDLKPGNIMIDPKGEPIIMDFGLACRVRRREGEARLTQSGMLVGSPAYMSPEQVDGEPDRIGAASDQYSLGVILYEMLTGQLPFRGSITAVIGQIASKHPTPPGELRPELDSRIEAVCVRMMAKKSVERFETVKEVAVEAARILKSPERPATGSAAATAVSPADPQVPAKRVPDAASVRGAGTSITAGNVESLHEAARKCMRRHDYEQVVQMLETLPEHKRNEEVVRLLTKARQLSDEVQFLLAEIDEALRVNDSEALGKKTDELLKLKPNHHKARQIKEELGRYGGGLFSRRRRRKADGRRVGEGSWIPWAVVAFGVAVFGVASWLVYDYLRSDGTVINPDTDSGTVAEAPSPGEWIDLVPLIDPRRDRFDRGFGGANDWIVQDGELSVRSDHRPAKLLFPLMIDGSSLEWEITFTRTAGERYFTTDIPANSGVIPVEVGLSSETISVGPNYQNRILEGPCEVENGRQRTVRIRVQREGRLDRIEVVVDGESIGEWTGDRESVTKELSGNDNYRTDQQTGLFVARETAFKFHSIRLRMLDGEARLLNGTVVSTGTGINTSASTTDWIDLFNGRDLTGWQGLAGYWRWENGELVGSTQGGRTTRFNRALCSERSYRDFEVQFDVKLEGNSPNSGLQIRSEITDLDEYVVAGPQADMGGEYWGCLYGERSGGMMKQADETAVNRALRPGDWNAYAVRCVGKRVTITINGIATVDDEFPSMPDEGILGWQLHAGDAMTARFRNIRLRELNATPSALNATGSLDDWTELFNGRDLTGWRYAYNNRSTQTTNETWTVDQSRDVLGESGDNKNWIETDQVYDDFELELDWRVLERDADLQEAGGIIVWSNGMNRQGQWAGLDPSGVEIDLWRRDRQGLDDRIGTGCLICYGVSFDHAHGSFPDPDAGMFRRNVRRVRDPLQKAAGEWNSARLKCEGGSLKVWMNGVLVNEAGNSDVQSGRICLRGGRAPIEYRNIRIRELNTATTETAGWTSFFNGRDLNGWKAVRSPANWSVEQDPGGNMLVGAGTSGIDDVFTTQRYSDFELELEYRLRPGGNSGIWIRTPNNSEVGFDNARRAMNISLLDDASPNWARYVQEPSHRTGGLYGVAGPMTRISAPANDWHHVRVRAEGRHLMIAINGAQVQDLDLDDAFRGRPEQVGLTRTEGHIGLEDHGNGRVEFRNVRIRDLNSD